MEGGEPKAAREPLVSVIVVSHNVKDLLLDCLTALFEGTEIPFEAIVVDNNSKDGSAAAVEAAYPRVKLHRMNRNLGSGRAANAGLEKATGRFVLLLGADVMVAKGCVDELADFLLVRQDAGAVGPRLIQPDGRLDPLARRAFPSPRVAFYRFSGLSRIFPRSSHFGRHNMGHLSAEKPHEIDAGSASCLLVRRAAIAKIGFLDPAYRQYGEDLDLCYRLKQGGWKIFYVASAEAVHVTGAPTRKESAKMLYEFHSAMWTFHHKHYADDLPAFGNGLYWAAIWTRWAVLSGWSAESRKPSPNP